PAVRAAYDAPFPDRSYEAAARALPRLTPASPDDPAAQDNRRAWEALERFDQPFLTAFAPGAPIVRGAHRPPQPPIPGARGQPHTRIHGAGHFVQEDKGPELARVVADFIART